MAKDSNALVGLQRALPQPDSLAAYLTAAFIVAIATAIKFPLDAWAGETLPPYITYYPALVLATLSGGPRIGFITAAATLLLAWYLWLPTQYSFALTGASTSLTLGIYAVSSALLAWIVGFARLMIDEVVASEAERSLSAHESVHRIKNLVAVVQALSTKIAREVELPEEYRDILGKRLEALGTAQNVLIRQDWNDAQLNEIISGSLAPFLPNPGLQLRPGPPVVVPARHVNGLCLALYELCTNAMKYGALATGEGPVSLTWRCEGGVCVLEWREARRGNGASEKSGFGSVLIKSALSHAPETRVDYEFTPTNVTAVFRWPAAQAA